MAYIKKTPIAMSSLALAWATLGNLLLPYGEWVRGLCGGVSALLLLLFIAKLIVDHEELKKETHNPVVLGILPTATMTLILLCAYVKPYVGVAAVVVWYAALAAQVGIMLLFFKRFVLRFSLQNVYTSWFVVCVCLAAASVTSPVMNAQPLGQVLFCVGLGLYLMVLPVVIYRVAKISALPEQVRPILAIFTSPVNLCLAGYFAAFTHPKPFVVYGMLSLSVISYIFVAVNMPFLLRLPFYPSYAAFAFPYAISAVAFRVANAFLVEEGIYAITWLPKISEGVAVVVVVYVLIRYVLFFFKAPVVEPYIP